MNKKMCKFFWISAKATKISINIHKLLMYILHSNMYNVFDFGLSLDLLDSEVVVLVNKNEILSMVL